MRLFMFILMNVMWAVTTVFIVHVYQVDIEKMEIALEQAIQPLTIIEEDCYFTNEGQDYSLKRLQQKDIEKLLD